MSCSVQRYNKDEHKFVDIGTISNTEITGTELHDAIELFEDNIPVYQDAIVNFLNNSAEKMTKKTKKAEAELVDA